NRAPDRDYLLALAAEVPNRSLVPLSFGVATQGHAQLAAASLADADYLAVAARTDLLQGNPSTQTLAAVVRYAENLEDWRDELVIDDADFPPMFKVAATDYDDYTGIFKWAFDGDASALDYVLITARRSWMDQFDRYFGIFPADAGEVKVPFGSLGFYQNWIDTVTAVAVDLPEDAEDGFDPTRLLGYDNARFSVWCEEPLLAETLYELLSLIDW
ncbi:MAG: hypothetical protein KJ042_15455, partial [Deltaproteobacteria bacterium]|nr:hypothetical protein [Deltaproteobacteria bacterium]